VDQYMACTWEGAWKGIHVKIACGDFNVAKISFQGGVRVLNLGSQQGHERR